MVAKEKRDWKTIINHLACLCNLVTRVYPVSKPDCTLSQGSVFSSVVHHQLKLITHTLAKVILCNHQVQKSLKSIDMQGCVFN
jgi:hypothetical protein